MENVGWAGLAIIPTFDGLQGDLEKGSSKALLAAGHSGGTQFGDAAGKSAGSRFGTVFKNAAKAALVGLTALGVGAFKLAKDSVSAASDLEESTNKVAEVFGNQADRVFRFTEKAADALGQTNTQARDAAATFGIFGQAAELSDRQSAKFARKMTTLASDLASFNNTEPDQAVQALGAALRGESEPIRAYGVLLDEATLKAEALALGILKPVKDEAKIAAYTVAITEKQRDYNEAVAEHGKSSIEALKAEASLGTSRAALTKATEGTIPPLTQQQKLLAAQSQIFKQTEVAQGDFGRTSDGLANQQRRLSARFEDAKAELGKGLLPVMTDAADFVLDKGLPAFESFSDWFNKKGIPAFGDFTDKVRPLVKELLPAMGDALGFARDALKDALPFAEDVVDAFNNLPDGVKKGLVAGGGLIAARKLLGGGGGGSTGGRSLSPFGIVGATKDAAITKSGELVADRLLAKFQKPLPVYVVNKGALGGGADPIVGGPDKKPGKTSIARNVLRALPPLLAADAGYEAVFGDLYGFAPPKDKPPAPGKIAPARPGSAAFGISAFPGPDDKKTVEKSERTYAKFYGTVTQGANAAEKKVADVLATAVKLDTKLDVMGAKKFAPEFRVPGLASSTAALEHFLDLQRESAGIAPGFREGGAPNGGDGGLPDARGRGDTPAPKTGMPKWGGSPAPMVYVDKLVAHDYNDFVTQSQRRAQRAGLGGHR